MIDVIFELKKKEDEEETRSKMRNLERKEENKNNVFLFCFLKQKTTTRKEGKSDVRKNPEEEKKLRANGTRWLIISSSNPPSAGIPAGQRACGLF